MNERMNERMNVWTFVMVGGGNDNNRLGFNGKCEPVDLFIQNNCIQWMDEFLYMKRIQRFGYDSKWMDGVQWMDEFIQNGRHPVHRPLLFFLLFPPPYLPYPSPKASFPVVGYCCSEVLHTAGLLCVAAAGFSSVITSPRSSLPARYLFTTPNSPELTLQKKPTFSFLGSL